MRSGVAVFLGGTLLAALGGAAIPAQEKVPPPPQPKPHLVTLPGDPIVVADALAAVARQTGIPIEDRRGEAGQPIRLDLRDVPFWQAADTIAAAANAQVVVSPRDGAISLVKRLPGLPPVPVSHSGSFRVALQRLQTWRDFESGGRGSVATLEVFWEPSLQPLFLETRPHDLVVKPDRGEPLPARLEGSSLAPVDGRFSLAFDVPLPALPRQSERLALLQGRLSAIAPSQMLRLDFGPLPALTGADSPARQIVRDGVTCRVTDVKLFDTRWTVQVAVEIPRGGVLLESYQPWVVINEMYLESGDGKRLASSSYNLDSSSARKALVSYHFTDRGRLVRGKPESWRLVYRTAAGIATVPLEFSFRDVDLS
jgi:hypothetical protein